MNLAPEFQFSQARSFIVAFWNFCRSQLEEKNKEFYDLKVANTTQDMSLRDAQFKIKDLENSLKNEITLHQSIARRYEFQNSHVIRESLIDSSREKLMINLSQEQTGKLKQ